MVATVVFPYFSVFKKHSQHGASNGMESWLTDFSFMQKSTLLILF